MLNRIYKSILRRAKRASHISLLQTKSPEAIFSTIYEKNFWGDKESVSGSGSSLEYTANLRAELPKLFNQFAVKSMYDAPCGDFNWIRNVLLETKIRYIGADIVPVLIEKNAAAFTDDRTQFLVADITSSPLPDVDLFLCRDCLFHLSVKDAYRVFENFAASNAKYILTTTHINKAGFVNKDILTGDYRLLDLFAQPFGLPADTLFRIEDWIAPYTPREMCLWSRDQILAWLATKKLRT
jgi:hypothetical protein